MIGGDRGLEAAEHLRFVEPDVRAVRSKHPRHTGGRSDGGGEWEGGSILFRWPLLLCRVFDGRCFFVLDVTFVVVD